MCIFWVGRWEEHVLKQTGKWSVIKTKALHPPSYGSNPFFLGVEQHRRAQTAQANFRPAAVLVPGQQRYAQTGVAAKKNYVHGWATFRCEHAPNTSHPSFFLYFDNPTCDI